MTAAFLYWDGYRERISWISFSFWALNLKGMLGLLSGVSRCCGGVLVPLYGSWMGFEVLEGGEERTTWRTSLHRVVDAVKNRCCG